MIRLGDGTLVDVGRKIYLEWYRSERRERYQRERDRKYGVCSLEKLHEKGYFPEQSVCTGETAEEAALRNEYSGRLNNAIQRLPEQDARLVRFLYFDGVTVKKSADIFGCSRKTIQNRRKRILGEIRKLMGEI